MSRDQFGASKNIPVRLHEHVQVPQVALLHFVLDMDTFIGCFAITELQVVSEVPDAM